jgi:hypothetical protein
LYSSDVSEKFDAKNQIYANCKTCVRKIYYLASHLTLKVLYIETRKYMYLVDVSVCCMESLFLFLSGEKLNEPAIGKRSC